MIRLHQNVGKQVGQQLLMIVAQHQLVVLLKNERKMLEETQCSNKLELHLKLQVTKLEELAQSIRIQILDLI